MTDDDRIDSAALDTAGLTDMDVVRADIEATRAELAETVDALSDKLNVKARAGDKVSEARQKLTQAASRAKASTPPQVQHALDRAGQKAAPAVQQVSAKAAPHRGKIVAALAAVAVVLVVVRRRHGDDA